MRALEGERRLQMYDDATKELLIGEPPATTDENLPIEIGAGERFRCASAGAGRHLVA